VRPWGDIFFDHSNQRPSTNWRIGGSPLLRKRLIHSSGASRSGSPRPTSSLAVSRASSS
jgi:hypothetical protein